MHNEMFQMSRFVIQKVDFVLNATLFVCPGLFTQRQGQSFIRRKNKVPTYTTELKKTTWIFVFHKSMTNF